jgi:hypothetical protein
MHTSEVSTDKANAVSCNQRRRTVSSSPITSRSGQITHTLPINESASANTVDGPLRTPAANSRVESSTGCTQSRVAGTATSAPTATAPPSMTADATSDRRWFTSNPSPFRIEGEASVRGGTDLPVEFAAGHEAKCAGELGAA